MSFDEKGKRRERLAASLRRHPATVIATVALLSSMLGTAAATQVVVKETRTVQSASSTDSAQAAKKKKKARRGPRGPQGPAGSDASIIGAPASGDLAGSSFPNLVVAPGAITPGKIGTIPAVSATYGAAPTIPNNDSTPAAMNAENFDTAGMHATGANNSRLTAPITGTYQISGHVNWGGNLTGLRIVDLYVNGALEHTLVAAPSGTSSVIVQPFASLVRLTAGQYAELQLYQDSGGNLNGGAQEFSMTWVGP